MDDGREMPRFRRPTLLLREFMKVNEAFEKQLGSELRVNPTDLLAMELLVEHGPMKPTELAHRLGISTASMTTSIDRLTGLGHVERVPHPTDRRGVLVVPSPASAERAMSRLMPMIIDLERELDAFTEAEQDAIARYLERVVARYRAHAAPVGTAENA